MARDIYLDNSATTPICEEALEKYLFVSKRCYGNPSSLHTRGHEAEQLLDEARNAVKASLGADDCQVLFTSSGTEANNLAIIGRAHSKERYRGRAKLLTTKGEHASVSEPLNFLAREGYRTASVSTRGGAVDIDELSRELSRDVILVSVMMVNNETGAVYDLPAISRLVKDRCPDALFHVDATQGYLKLPFTMKAIGADMLTVSSHKIHGPKGVGALIVKDSVIKTRGLSPVVFGGGQEMGLRSGTQNVPAIAAFGEAVRLGHKNLRENIEKTAMLRALLIERLSEDSLAEIKPTLPPRYAPHILNITLPGIKSETMLHFLSSRSIFVSSGSACSSNSQHKSSALVAYGHTDAEADTSIRISFSHINTADDVHALADALSDGLKQLSRIKR